jgi:hypothetical protein
MAAIPVTIVGMMSYSGLEVGGGPIMPPATQPPAQPPGIWGPPGPWPSPPIYIPPTPPAGGPVYPSHPIYLPPVISGPPGPWPTPPIHLPPEQPPEEVPPGPGNGWNYYPQLGWVWTSPGGKWHYVGGDKPQPPEMPSQPPESGTPPEQPSA